MDYSTVLVHIYIYIHCTGQDEATAVKVYDAWNAKVIAMVPPERLLVFQTGKHGYKELVDVGAAADEGSTAVYGKHATTRRRCIAT